MQRKVLVAIRDVSDHGRFAREILAFFILVISLLYFWKGKKKTPISVNYHFSRVCNYSCGFCFHTSKTSNMATLEEAKLVLTKLKKAGMRKLNFAGGEPLLNQKYVGFVGELSRFLKNDLKLDCISVVTNGSMLKRSFFVKFGEFIDIIAVSCDSFNEDTNIQIGRGNGNQVEKLKMISQWCLEFNIKFKINSVINNLNWNEDMNYMIQELSPFRWKCFQVLILETENDGNSTLRNAHSFEISKEKFDTFIENHKSQKCLVPESADIMKNSYIILDENLCLLNSQLGKKPSRSLLEISVDDALSQAQWDEDAFHSRGGIYDWKKSSCNTIPKEFEW